MLYGQLEKSVYKDEVEVLYLIDNRCMTVGDKRNRLKSIAKGEYVVFVDDDDRIADSYIDELVKATWFNKDVIVFDSIYTENNISKLMSYSIEYENDFNTEDIYYRIPDCRMCIKRNVVDQVIFRDISYGEDYYFAIDVKELLKTEYKINKTLYYYDFNSQTSESYKYRNHKLSLLEILEKYDINGFDKDGGTDKESEHSYLNTYTELLTPYVNKKITLLEIGVKNGGSSLLWNDFLPEANIIMIDLENLISDTVIEKLDSSRCVFYLGDAYSNNTIDTILKDYPKGLDVVIDDGPHSLESQILCIRRYLPLLNKGGCLIIEDIQNIENLNTLQLITKEFYNIESEGVDLRTIKNRYDDLLFIIKKN